MTAAINTASKLTATQSEYLAKSLTDLKRALTETTEEMAESRNQTYLSPRSWADFKGIHNIYYHLLCVVSIDPSKKDSLVSKAAPTVQADIARLEEIRTLTDKQQLEAIEKAIRSGLSKETLKVLFSKETMGMIFEKKSNALHILEAIDKTVTIEEKVERVKPLSPPQAIVSAPVSPRMLSVAPPTANDEKLAQELQGQGEIEPDTTGDEDLASHLQEQEEALDQAKSRTESGQVKRPLDTDEEYARTIQEQEKLFARYKRAHTTPAAAQSATPTDEEIARKLQEEENRALDNT